MLDEAKSLEKIKSIREKAEAARNHVKAAKLGLKLQNCAAEVKRQTASCGRLGFGVATGNQRRTLPL
jgi:hypothetical protein